jgi:Uma2 family endonuclease
MVTTRPWTDEELMRLPDDGRKYELVDGELVVSPAGGRHGRTIVRLTTRLSSFVDTHRLGEVFDSSTGYRMPGGNLRAPDVSFVSTPRLPEGGVPKGFLYVAPDLAVEVLSPDDRPRPIIDKVGEYLAAGVRLVWVIDPERANVVAYRSLTDVQDIPAGGSLDGGEVVSGFSCPLPALFT